MPDLPPYEVLAGLDRGVICGLMAEYGKAAQVADLDHGWERDRALLRAVDDALVAASKGKSAEVSGPPRWLAGLVRRHLTSVSQSFHAGFGGPFVRIRLLERLGLIDLEPDDTYVLGMVSGLGSHKIAKLKSDPDLIDRALWRVFEVEGGGEVSLTNIDRFADEEWRKAFLSLTADGTLDRGKVLAECLQALRRDFLAYRAGWYTATFLALEPTLDELERSQGALRQLLPVALPATVALAVKQLRRLQRAERLEVGETLVRLPSAALVKTKGAALDVLLLARAAGNGHGPAVAEIARTALGHQHPEVQRAAADLLWRGGQHGSVAEAADELAPSVRHDLGLHVAAMRGLNERPRQHLAPIPRPVTSADLAERAAALLEDACDVGELEVVLAALVEPGSEERLAPLRKRAKAIVDRGPHTDVGDSWLPGQVARLVLTLLGDRPEPADPGFPALRFLVSRFSELRQSAGPLLATPDLPGGWVSARALVDRLVANPRPRHHDLAAALLRLYPDDRDQAAPGDKPGAVELALTGLVPKGRPWKSAREGPQAWWVAAERSRAPYTYDETPRIHSELRLHRWYENGRERHAQHGTFAIATAMQRAQATDLPTELGHGRSKTWSLGTTGRFLGDWIPSLAAIWPHDAEHFLAITCRSVLEAPNWTEAAHDVPRVLDALARHPGRLGTLATHTLAAGLSASRRDHRLHAIDAFLDLVPTGRIASAELAGALANHGQAWPANRWAESLSPAAQGPGGSEAVVSVLTALLPQLPVDARGLNRLLELLRDETIRHGWSLNDPGLRHWLRQHGGSSKTAKAARLLLG